MISFEISGTKNRIAIERARYNELVGKLNTRLNQLPERWLAGTLRERPYFRPEANAFIEPDVHIIP